MALNRVSGNLLSDNLVRGSNLAIQTDLVFVDIVGNRVGVNTSSTTQVLTVNGNAKIDNLVLDTNTLSTVTGNLTLSPAANLDIGGKRAGNASDPENASDLATKNYVDNTQANTGFVISDGSNTSSILDGDTLTVNGTVDQITAVVGADSLTLSLPANVTVSGLFTANNIESNNSIYVGNFIISGDTISSDANIVLTPTALGVVDINAVTSINLPAGNTAQRTVSPVSGTLRYNTDSNALEIYNGVSWEAVGVNYAAITNQQITGDGSTVTFTLDEVTVASAIIVSTNGVVQEPDVAYTVSGDQITFAEAPLVTDVIDVRFIASTTVVSLMTNTAGNASVEVTPSGNINVYPSSGHIVDVGATRISNLATPTTGSDATTKDYVDGLLTSVITVSDGSNTQSLGDGDTLTLQGTANQISVVVGATDTATFGLPSAVTISGNMTAGNFVTAGQATATGNITGGNLISLASVYANADVVVGDRANSSATKGRFVTGTSFTYIQTGNGTAGSTGNIVFSPYFSSTQRVVIDTATGNLTAVGNITGGNLVTAGLISATGNITGGNLVTAGLISATGNITGGNLNTAGQVVATGNVTGGNLITAGLGSFGTTVVATGNITGGNIITAGTVSTPSIAKTGSNAVGNIGSSDNYFNTVFAQATSAVYADLAERFATDQLYPPGTVTIFAGDQEVTISRNYADTRLCGIISTEPAYLMNAGQKNGQPIAFAGRVPCLVVGPIEKGDVLTTSNIPGHARRLDAVDWKPGVIVGKALQSCGTGQHTIMVVVGSW